MTAKQSPRPEPGARSAFGGAAASVPAEQAHLFGLGGVSEVEAAQGARRGMQALAVAWPEVLAQIIRRALRQAFLEALPAYWVRRAEELEAVGTDSAWASAAECRRHAWLLTQELPPEIAEAIDEAVR